MATRSICKPFSISFNDLVRHSIMIIYSLRDSSFFEFCGALFEDTYPQAILAFWSSCSFSSSRGLSGQVFEYNVLLSREKVAELIGCDDEGEVYRELWQRDYPQAHIDQLVYRYENLTLSQRNLYSSLSHDAKILHHLITSVLCPRTDRLEDVTDKDLFIIFSIMNEECINVVDIVYNHLISAAINSEQAIPYGFLITKFLRNLSALPFEAWDALEAVSPDLLDAAFFRSKGFQVDEPFDDDEDDDDDEDEEDV